MSCFLISLAGTFSLYKKKNQIGRTGLCFFHATTKTLFSKNPEMNFADVS